MDAEEAVTPEVLEEDSVQAAIAALPEEERKNLFVSCLSVGDCFASHMKTVLCKIGSPESHVDALIFKATVSFTDELARAYGLAPPQREHPPEPSRIILPH